VHWSFDYDPANPPSVQIAQMSLFNRGIEGPIDMNALENSLKQSFVSVCHEIDGPVITQTTLKSLAHYLRCTPAYLARIHSEHRRDVLGVTDVKALKIARERQEAQKAAAKMTSEGRMRETRVKSEGPGWGLPTDDLLIH
jgi:hypothetical protein